MKLGGNMPGELGSKPKEFVSKDNELADAISKKGREIESSRERIDDLNKAIDLLNEYSTFDFVYTAQEMEELDSAKKLLEKYRLEFYQKDIDAKEEVNQQTLDKRELNTLRAEKHFRQNEEA